MRNRCRQLTGLCGIAFSLLLAGGQQPLGAAELRLDNPLNPPGPLYWCPARTPDQRIAAAPEPGCAPLADKEVEAAVAKQGKPTDTPPIRAEQIQGEVSKFVTRYRQFLDCCANDAGHIDRLEALQADAAVLLLSIQKSGILMAASGCGTICRQWTLGETIQTVAHAWDDLKQLKTRLEQIEQTVGELPKQDYETAGRVRRQIQQEKEAIAAEFQPRRPPESAPTGMEIEHTSLPNRIGKTIEQTTLPNTFGADIGETASPGSHPLQDLNFRRGVDTNNTSLPNATSRAIEQQVTGQTSLPTAIGFEAGTEEGPTGPSSLPSRAGPSIGSSSLNSR